MKTVAILLSLLSVGCSGDLTSPPETKYSFERFNLPDGTPCYHVKVSGHGAKSGVTCNYNEVKR